MTTTEIKDLIASAIAGQGNQVDARGKLAEILNALADSAGGGGVPVKLTAPTLTDYGFLSQVRERINNGLLYDTIIVYFEQTQSLPPGPKETVEYLPVSFNENDQEVRIARGYDPKAFIVPDYTETQFEGVAAIQEALESPFLVDLVTAVLDPEGSEEQEDIYLMEDNSSAYICVDGYLLEIGTSEIEEGEVVTSITKSNLQPVEGEDFVNITMEDAQKLIGIPINRV